MLLSRQTGEYTHFLCPYCGVRIPLYDRWNATIDHIVPRSQWYGFRATKTYTNRIRQETISSVNDKRNQIWCCRKCNRSKDATFIVPNWRVNGWFKLWEVNDLREFAGYFYFWSPCFIESFERDLKDNNESELLAERYSRLLAEIEVFKKQYELRTKEDYWYIDNI